MTQMPGLYGKSGKKTDDLGVPGTRVLTGTPTLGNLRMILGSGHPSHGHAFWRFPSFSEPIASGKRSNGSKKTVTNWLVVDLPL